MLTIEEILADVSESPEFEGLGVIDVNTRARNGDTPLHWMAVLGDGNAIEMLAAAGAEIDAVNNERQTPLHIAVIWRQISAIAALRNAGADLGAENNEGLTPLSLARRDDFTPAIEALT